MCPKIYPLLSIGKRSLNIRWILLSLSNEANLHFSNQIRMCVQFGGTLKKNAAIGLCMSV